MQIEADVDEADIGKVQHGQLVRFQVDAYPERRFSGEVAQVRKAATNTNNVVTYKVIINAPNQQQLLLPGMYVRATLETGINTAAILAPQRGISRNAKGEATALVVNAAGTVEPRLVKASRTVAVNGGAADQWLIEEGLAAGDQLIVEGLQKVRPGAPAKAVPFNPTAAAPTGQNKVTGAN